MLQKIRAFVQKEMVLCIAALCAIATMFFVPPDIHYLEYIDFRVLCLLLCLMAVVAGFKSVGVFGWLTSQMLRRTRSGPVLGVLLVLLPFFSAMLVTNDVALIVFIPFTLGLLEQLQCRRAIPVIVLQTIAANLGSMATPVGNPQNLFLYGFFNMNPGDFFSVTLPLTAVSLVALVLASLPLLPKQLQEQQLENTAISSGRHLAIYGALFGLCLLTVFRVIPYPVTTAVIVVLLFLLDRSLLKEIDFILLITFVCFFIVSENLGRIEAVRSFLQALLEKSTLLTAAGASQVISNVPAAVLLSGFTDQWRELLAGVNIGGLGTPVASLASLITMKIYAGWKDSNMGGFLGFFTLANLLGLAILLGYVFIFGI